MYYLHTVYQSYSHPVLASGKRSKVHKLGQQKYDIQSFDSFDKAVQAWIGAQDRIRQDTVSDQVITDNQTKLSISIGKEFSQHSGASYPTIHLEKLKTAHRLTWRYLETEAEYGLEDRSDWCYITNEIRQDVQYLIDNFYEKRETLDWDTRQIR